MKNPLTLAVLCIGIPGIMACSNKKETVRTATVQSQIITVAGTETPIYIGGYGSSMAYSEKDSCFYLLTDRGPNVEGATSESKVFPIPRYIPHIGKFRLQDSVLVLIEKIELKEANATPFSGIPNSKGDGATNETAYNLQGEIIANTDRRGIDPEGLALAPDGSFWISDEYAPYILHFDSKGLLIEEFSPFNGVLPAHYATRRPNRGMEGLTISKDGNTLYGIMQSPLYYPDKSTKDKSQILRIVSIDIATRKVSEYLYRLENPDMAVSEIIALNNSEFLVLERDGDFPQHGKGFKKIFKINLSKATNVAGDSSYFETMTAGELSKTNIRLVEKQLYVDILAAIPHYPHDKPEGIALITAKKGAVLYIVNDDDFAINAPAVPDGTIVPKQTAGGQRDTNRMYFVFK
ncbi:MAG: esterase-like activity of phytase family protein [Prevotellaceae bacterium]|jgi:hypothetical protein|nr:esterase-like activity of phytase family protein [Prevotellaceae bacterium]